MSQQGSVQDQLLLANPLQGYLNHLVPQLVRHSMVPTLRPRSIPSAWTLKQDNMMF